MDHEKVKQFKPVVEALLMATDRALNLNEMRKIMTVDKDKPSLEVLKEIIEQLSRECEGRAYQLQEVASGYRYQTRAEYAVWLAKLWEQKPPRYSRAALETLALIAYRQPVTRAAIEEVRGVAVSTNIIRGFEECGWIEVVGYKETPGRPALYATTKTFLDDFNLCSLDELPELPELSQQVDILPPHLREVEMASAEEAETTAHPE